MSVPSPSGLRLINALTRLSRIVAWVPPVTTQPLLGFNIYRGQTDRFQDAIKQNSSPISITFYQDTIQTNERVESFTFYYFVTSVDQGNNESAPAGPVWQEFTPFFPNPKTSTIPSTRRIADEIRRRHGKIQKFDGLVAHYLVRKVAGALATDYDPLRRDVIYRSVTSTSGNTATGAFGTRFQGGYTLIPNVLVRFIPVTERLTREEMGLVATRVPTMWVTDFPILQSRDIVIFPNNERYKLVTVRPQSIGGRVTRQVAELEYLAPEDIIYSFPLPEFVNPSAPVDPTPQEPFIAKAPDLPKKSSN